MLQAFLTMHETHVIERSIAREEHLMNEQQELEAEVTELARLAVIKVSYWSLSFTFCHELSSLQST